MRNRSAPPAAALAPLLLLLAGCTAEPSIADCGLVLHVPARPIDEGVRYDVRELVGDPLPVEVVGYRFFEPADPNGAVFHGNLGALLASGGNHTLRFLDDRKDKLLQLGDAFVVRNATALLLQLDRGGDLVGSSVWC